MGLEIEKPFDKPLLCSEFNKPSKQNAYEVNLFKNFNFAQSKIIVYTDWYPERNIT